MLPKLLEKTDSLLENKLVWVWLNKLFVPLRLFELFEGTLLLNILVFVLFTVLIGGCRLKGLFEIEVIPIEEVFPNKEEFVKGWFKLVEEDIGITEVLFTWGFIAGEIIIFSSALFAFEFPNKFIEAELN